MGAMTPRPRVSGVLAPHHSLIVVGSGPAGVAAARAYLDAGGVGMVALFTADADLPYQRPPLSKNMLSDDSRAPEVVPILDAEASLEGIEVVTGAEVVAVDVLAHTVRLAQGERGWDRLVLAPGSHPLSLTVTDRNVDVHHLRTLEDARRLHAAAKHARSAVVIGSGFVGCEVAASLAARGIGTVVVTPEQGPQRERLGARASLAILEWLSELGVVVQTGVRVTSIEAPRTVHTSDGRTHRPDLVIVAIGVAPSTEFLQGSGLTTHEGRIVVDDHMRTSMPDVWAAGDAVHAHHTRAGRALSVEHWGDALAMGQVAGRSAAGDSSARWEDPPGFWSQIGKHQLKHAAWGDGWDELSETEHTGGFTVRYGQSGKLAGVLTYGADDDYAEAAELLGRVPFSSKAPKG